MDGYPAGEAGGMRIEDDHEVGEAEQVTRFVCGAVLGIVVAIVAILVLELTMSLSILVVSLVSMFACGLAALIWGDRFWYDLLK